MEKVHRVHISLMDKDNVACETNVSEDKVSCDVNTSEDSNKIIKDNLLLCPKCDKTEVTFNQDKEMYEIYCDCKFSTSYELEKAIRIFNALVKSNKSYNLLHTFGTHKGRERLPKIKKE